MTTGELRAQPKKCTFLPRRAEEEAQIAATPLLSEGHFGNEPPNNPGAEGGLCPPRAWPGPAPSPGHPHPAPEQEWGATECAAHPDKHH